MFKQYATMIILFIIGFSVLIMLHFGIGFQVNNELSALEVTKVVEAGVHSSFSLQSRVNKGLYIIDKNAFEQSIKEDIYKIRMLKVDGENPTIEIEYIADNYDGPNFLNLEAVKVTVIKGDGVKYTSSHKVDHRQ